LNRYRTTKYPSSTAYNTAPNKKQFSKLIELTESLLLKHEKLLICRLNLTAEGLDDHDDIQYLINKVKDTYKSDYYGYAWSCEWKETIGKHYHIVFFLNGNKYKSDYIAMNDVGRWWTLRNGLYYWVSRFDSSKGFINSLGILKRSDEGKFNDVIYGLSYLCKTSQKPDSSLRWFNCTQLKSITDPTNYRKAA
jgi:hypothetical protein